MALSYFKKKIPFLIIPLRGKCFIVSLHKEISDTINDVTLYQQSLEMVQGNVKPMSQFQRQPLHTVMWPKTNFLQMMWQKDTWNIFIDWNMKVAATIDRKGTISVWIVLTVTKDERPNLHLSLQCSAFRASPPAWHTANACLRLWRHAHG